MSMTRRGFIGGCAAFAAALGERKTWAAALAGGKLPEFYAAYLDDIVRRDAANGAKGGAGGFIFFTDPHVTANYGRSGHLIAEIVRRTDLKRVWCGGDFSVAFSYGKKPKPFVERLYGTMLSDWRDPIEAAGGRLLTAKGNHDLRAWIGWDKSDGFVYASATTRRMLIATQEFAAVTTNPEEKDGVYYYQDDAASKTRLVVADTTSGVLAQDLEGAAPDYGGGITSAQLRWLAEVALGTVPAGYRVIVMHHIPVVAYVGERKDEKFFADFRHVLEAYQNRGKAVTKAGTFDYSSRAGGDILVDLTGHMHADRYAYSNGIFHLTVICDSFYNDPVWTSPFCGRLFGERKERANTVKEQAFDLFRLAGDVIRTTRVGVGHDRIFHTKPLMLRVGGKAKLASELPDVKWFAYDSLTAKENPKDRDPATHWTFFSTCATAAPDGAVTALKPGWSTVVAMAPDFRTEVFGVEVVG